MALNQISAVTGKRIKPNYVEAINAQVPYLPALKSAERSDALTNRALDLQAQELQEQNEIAAEALAQAKRQARVGNLLSAGNLALKTGLGLYGESKNPITTPVMSKTAQNASNGELPFALLDGGMGSAGTFGGGKPSFFSSEGAGTLSNWTGAANDWTNAAAGLAGTLAARTLGKDKGTGTKAAIGAGTSALAQAIISGGDPYKTVISGVLGGIGGMF